VCLVVLLRLSRDVKPCNLLLFADGYLKLADLGCCCQLPAGVSAGPHAHWHCRVPGT